MEDRLPLFNFSLKKVLDREPDSFKKAKIKIVLTLLTVALLKIIFVFAFATYYRQYQQLIRAIVLAPLIIFAIKTVLSRPEHIKALSHLMMITGLVTIWTSLFVFDHKISIVSLQMIYMVTLVSYYLIGGVKAAIYTTMAIAPALLSLILGNSVTRYAYIGSDQLPVLFGGIFITLNFLNFILAHYLYYRAFHQNLREKEALNEQLEVNIREVKALAESRSVFLSTMSHELRTPLNGVIGMANLLKDTAYPEQKENLNILEFSANNLLSVINDILDYNKSEVDKIELESIPVNLHALLKKISDGMEVKAAEKALAWKLDLDQQLVNRSVMTDPTRLTQILYNLTGNAVKFTDEGMISVTVKVLGLTENKMAVDFTVSDTGIGIAADRQEMVFNPFMQASSNTTRHFGGTGLGLAIVKRLLRLFRSDIRVKSQPGAGSEFSFTILFNLYPDQGKTVAEVIPMKRSIKGLSVLIVEDNEVNVLLLQKLMSKWEVQTTTARNGKEGVEKLMDANVDVILMDLHMPVMDGYVAAKTIRGLSDPIKAGIPIIAITASVSGGVNNRIKEAGINEYLPKPFQTDQLFEKLQQMYASLGQ